MTITAPLVASLLPVQLAPIGEIQVANTGSPPPTSTFYLLDNLGNVLTDNLGNRLTFQ